MCPSTFLIRACQAPLGKERAHHQPAFLLCWGAEGRAVWGSPLSPASPFTSALIRLASKMHRFIEAEAQRGQEMHPGCACPTCQEEHWGLPPAWSPGHHRILCTWPVMLPSHPAPAARPQLTHRPRTGPFCCCCCSVASVVSDPVRPHSRQPTRLLCAWDSPGKNTGVGGPSGAPENVFIFMYFYITGKKNIIKMTLY